MQPGCSYPCLIRMAKGKILYDSLAEYKKQMLAVLNPKNLTLQKALFFRKKLQKRRLILKNNFRLIFQFHSHKPVAPNPVMM